MGDGIDPSPSTRGDPDDVVLTRHHNTLFVHPQPAGSSPPPAWRDPSTATVQNYSSRTSCSFFCYIHKEKSLMARCPRILMMGDGRRLYMPSADPKKAFRRHQ
ncbi:hypothetical protein DAI22_11g137950 [Oryza sativa Japonica Group]|nr:hypothetical protein DAI22_11g137950 [Oryza sativa Japonica Group]